MSDIIQTMHVMLLCTQAKFAVMEKQYVPHSYLIKLYLAVCTYETPVIGTETESNIWLEVVSWTTG